MQRAEALQCDWNHAAALLQQADRELHANMAALLMRVHDASSAHSRAVGRMQQQVASLAAARVGSMAEATRQRDAAMATVEELRARCDEAEAACASLRAQREALDARHVAEVHRLQVTLQEALEAHTALQLQRDGALEQLGKTQAALETTQRAMDEQQQALAASRAQCSALQGAVDAHAASVTSIREQLEVMMAWQERVKGSIARLDAGWALVEATTQEVGVWHRPPQPSSAMRVCVCDRQRQSSVKWPWCSRQG